MVHCCAYCVVIGNTSNLEVMDGAGRQAVSRSRAGRRAGGGRVKIGWRAGQSFYITYAVFLYTSRPLPTAGSFLLRQLSLNWLARFGKAHIPATLQPPIASGAHFSPLHRAFPSREVLRVTQAFYCNLLVGVLTVAVLSLSQASQIAVVSNLLNSNRFIYLPFICII